MVWIWHWVHVVQSVNDFVTVSVIREQTVFAVGDFRNGVVDGHRKKGSGFRGGAVVCAVIRNWQLIIPSNDWNTTF